MQIEIDHIRLRYLHNTLVLAVNFTYTIHAYHNQNFRKTDFCQHESINPRQTKEVKLNK